jgi:putative spermidine/putrescine transport system permease protein
MLLKKNNIVVILYVVIAVVPLLSGLTYALLYSFGLIGNIGPPGFTLTYWKAVFTEREILLSLLYSCYIAIVALILAVSFALWLTLLLKKEIEKGVFSYIIYFPLAIPAIVTAFFIFQLLSKSGFVSRIFFQLHLIRDIGNFPDLVNDHYSIAIIIAHILMALPFFTLLFINLYRSERIDDLNKLAKSMGAGKKQCLQMITLPVLLTKAIPNLVLYFIFILGSYEIPLILGRQSPQMVSVLIIRKLQKFDLSTIPQGYVIAIIYTIVVFFIMALLLRYRRASYAG